MQDLNDRPTTDEDASEPQATGREPSLGSHGIFPMRVVVQLTGLTPDTIRAWERRYGAIEPSRSAGNTRKFTQDDIRRLLLLREATEAGHSIGNIASLDEGALRALKGVTRPGSLAATPAPTALVSAEPEPERRVESVAPRVAVEAPLTTSVVEPYLELLQRFDVARASAWLRRAAALSAPRDFVLDVVSPLLVELRDRRADARLGGPHVVVAQQSLTASLQVLLELGSETPAAPEVLTVGAPRQRHAIGAMASALLARAHGLAGLFLGASVPDADVLWAFEALAGRVLLVDVSAPLSLELGPSSLTTLDRIGARQPVWVLWPPGSAPAPGLGHLERLADLGEVDRRLAALARAPAPATGGPTR